MNFMRQLSGGSRDAKKQTSNQGWTDEVEAMDKPKPTAVTAARKASLNALSSSAKPPPHPPTASSSTSSNGPSLEEKAQEYERRINVLTFCLEEQVMENAQLQKRLDTVMALYAPKDTAGGGMSGMYGGGPMGPDQPAAVYERMKALEAQLREKEDAIEELHEAHAKIEEEKDALQRELGEHRKKMDALAREVDEMKKEESAASSSSSSPAGDKAAGRSLAEQVKEWKDRYKRENELVYSYEETIERLKQAAKSKDRKYKTLTERLKKAKEQNASLQDSIEEYEKKLQKVEKDLMDSLHKEGERRMEAEYWQDSMRKKLKKLKKKLKKLQAKSGEGEVSTTSDDSASDTESASTETEDKDDDNGAAE